MAHTIHCDIVSAKEAIFSGNATLVVVHGVQGELGIMPGHAPLLSELAPGPVRVRLENGEEQIYYVSGGVLEVQPNVVTVLADTAVRAADVDEAAAIEARNHAADIIAKQKGDLDSTAALSALAEAAAQLRTLQAYRNRAGRG